MASGHCVAAVRVARRATPLRHRKGVKCRSYAKLMYMPLRRDYRMDERSVDEVAESR